MNCCINLKGELTPSTTTAATASNQQQKTTARKLTPNDFKNSINQAFKVNKNSTRLVTVYIFKFWGV